MPRRLPSRCRHDSIAEFRSAAAQRYNDGLLAAAAGRGLAAIYLWGYCAEMLVKAAYFAGIGIAEQTRLEMTIHIRPAIQLGRDLMISWPSIGAGHNIRAWSELLILERATNPNPPKSYNTRLEQLIQRNGQRISHLWNETLRYHRNRPYGYEIRQMREAAEWFLVNSVSL